MSESAIKELLEKWKARRDMHRHRRDFLNEHKFNIESAVENKLYLEIGEMIIDFEWRMGKE